MFNAVKDLLDKNCLGDAVATMLAAVKDKPTDVQARRLLIDLLIVNGDFERADKQADILTKIADELAVGIGLLRGRLRAENARSEWFLNGAVPSFAEEPTDRDKHAMSVWIDIRNDDPDAVKEAMAKEIMSGVSVNLNGQPVTGFRDVDDRVPHAFEVLCNDGSYMWVDFDTVASITFAPVSSVRDLVWRTAKLVLKNGSESEVTVCSTYFQEDLSDAEKLASETNWHNFSADLSMGAGQKIYLAGDDIVTALEMNEITEAKT